MNAPEPRGRADGRADGAAPLVGRALAVIDARLHDPAFGVAALAAALGQSRSGLARRLRAQSGQAPRVLIQERRLARAARLLAEADLPVGAVAEAAGFADPAYFARLFRATHGATPTAFRAAARGDADGRGNHVIDL